MRFAKTVTIVVVLNTDGDFTVKDGLMGQLSMDVDMDVDAESFYAHVTFTCDSLDTIEGNAVYCARNYLEKLSVAFDVSYTHRYLLIDLYNLCDGLIGWLETPDDKIEDSNAYETHPAMSKVYRYGDNEFTVGLSGNYSGTYIMVRLEDYPEIPPHDRLRAAVREWKRISVSLIWCHNPKRLGIAAGQYERLVLDGQEIEKTISLHRANGSVIDTPSALKDAIESNDLLADVYAAGVKLETLELEASWPTPRVRDRPDIGFIEVKRTGDDE